MAEQLDRTYVKVAPAPGGVPAPQVLLAGVLRRQFAGWPRPVLIAVGGPGGIGKTTFARRLAAELATAVVLELDDYKRPRTVRAGQQIYGPHPEANERELLQDHLRQLRQGITIQKPCYCRERGEIRDFVAFAPDRYVIVEGEIATYREFHGLMDFSIFIDAHWETQLQTRLRRDVGQRGYSLQKALATFLHSNLQEFTAYGAASKNWAAVHLHCARDYTLTLEAVCSESAAFLPAEVEDSVP